MNGILSFLLGVLTVIAPQVQIPRPPGGFSPTAADIVVDQAGVLSPATEDRINRIAFDVHQKTGGEIAVVTLSDLGGRDVAEVALRIGREWGVGDNAPIGSRARNAGIVVLVAPNDRQIRIEVGQGAEGFINDARAGDIRREATPYFQRGDFDGGLLLITTRIAERFAQEFGVSLDSNVAPALPPAPEPRPRGGGAGTGVGFLLFLFILMLIIGGMGRAGRRSGCGGNGCLWLLLTALTSSGHRGGYRRSGWGGGGFGGGSFGGGGGFGGFGGGGGFSGGGSSGSW